MTILKEHETNANNNTTHKKVVDVNIENNTTEKRAVEGYRLIDMTILAKLIGEFSCPERYDDIRANCLCVLILQKERNDIIC